MEAVSTIFDKPPPPIYVGLGDKRHTSRGKDSIERGWEMQAKSSHFPEELQKLNIDAVVTQAAENALAEERAEVVLLDIGSGRQGTFINSFADPEQYPYLHQFLTKNRDFKLRVIGVTAARSKRLNQGTQLPSPIDSTVPPHDRISIENYAYTITSAQTLDALLTHVDIPVVDVAFSTFGVGYFTPNNFEHCINDVADKLPVNGEFYGIKWQWAPPGFYRQAYGGRLLMMGKTKPGHPLRKLLNPYGGAKEYHEFKTLPPKEKIRTYLDTIGFVIKQNMISQDEVIEILKKPQLYPMPFIREFLKYATPEQLLDLSAKMPELTQDVRHIDAENWDQIRDLLEKLDQYEEKLRSLARDKRENQLYHTNSEYSDAIAKINSQVEAKYNSEYRAGSPPLPEFETLKAEAKVVQSRIDAFIRPYVEEKRRSVVQEIKDLGPTIRRNSVGRSAGRNRKT